MASTNSRGDATFRLDATGNQTYEARFGATAPGDITAYLPSASQPLNFVLGPTVSVKLSSPLRAGRKVVGVPGVKVRASGRVTPFVGGAQVTVRVTRNGKEVKRKSAAVTKSGNDGRFKLSFAVSKRGTYRVSAVQAATGGLGSGRSSAKRLFIVRPHAGPGSSGTAVRALQSRLKELGYLTPVNGSFDGSTSRAVLAFRKVYGMARMTVANKARVQEAREGRRPLPAPLPEGGQARGVRLVPPGARARARLAARSRSSTPRRASRPRRPCSATSTSTASRPATTRKGMYYSTYFVGGYAIHGYSRCPPIPASHGCIRIPIPSAIAVYRWIRLGNAIFVYK